MSRVWKPTYPPFYAFKKDVFRKAGRVAQFIYQIGEYPLLRQLSTEIPVEQITSSEYQMKFQYIKDCLVRYRTLTGYGRGITGVQIGVPERFSVIYTPESLLIIINPRILEKSERLLRYPEICMSANPIIAPVVRPAWITFEYFDEKGQMQIWNMKDDTERAKIMNRVFQHEIDHMDGFINIDRVESPSDLILESDPEFYAKASFEEVSI
jgi:peptide deformylase